MNELFQIYKKYSDRTDKGTKHSYIDFYEGLFLPYKNKEINLLEVGVQRGASLSMWQDYFVNAKIIVGVDLHPDKILPDERARWDLDKVHVVGSRSDSPDLLEEPHIKENYFDIIIDDGSHHYRHQLETFSNLYQKLKAGGVYVVEDVLGKTAIWRFKKYYEKLNPIHLDFIEHRTDLGRHSRGNQLIVFFKDD